MNTGLFYFTLTNIQSDSIDSINGVATGGLTASQLIAALPGIFWIQENINGDNRLCMSKVIGEPCTLTMNMSGTPYTAEPSAFVLIPDSTGNVIGPHPIKSYPGK